MARNKKWTEAEESRLREQVRLFPQNLSKCFLIVSEVTGRTQSAVANRWYNKVSKEVELKEEPKKSFWQRIFGSFFN